MPGGFWIRADGTHAQVSIGTSIEAQLVDNAGSSIQENRRLTCLGFYLTMFSATSNMYVARILTTPEMISIADLTATSPEDDDDMVWSKHYAHAGVPGYFQIKSKRTLGPDDHVYIQTWNISVVDDIHWSWQSYCVASG